ncbi:Pol polyprotein [Plakobranchus ocellatus]|uniref:Pol polyprotein n=1 Tax=Plakobranchus ocellatus TaxID=259542 RepID=A0AAV3Y4Q0_9GAST|nr:Pol polyprotein [Plakobranchus ocellatus]
MTLENIESETLKDRTLQAVIRAIKTGNWTQTSNFQSLEKQTYDTLNRCAHELSVTETGLILKERRIVLPFSLQDKAVQIAHSGHQGKTKTSLMLRQKVWFKNMHTAVEQAVKNCFACQVATPTTTREPLQMSDLQQEPWSKLSADFRHLPDGTYLLVVTDEYPCYVVVDTIKSTSARAVVPRFDKIFAEFGIPDELKTDNGPLFNGIGSKTYLEHMGIKHRKITPRWPQANAETERVMRAIKKTIKAAQAEHKNWKQEMFKFLLAYRTTKHSNTGLAPAKVLFNRVVKNKLPAAPMKTDPINTRTRSDRDEQERCQRDSKTSP